MRQYFQQIEATLRTDGYILLPGIPEKLSNYAIIFLNYLSVSQIMHSFVYFREYP